LGLKAWLGEWDGHRAGNPIKALNLANSQFARLLPLLIDLVFLIVVVVIAH
jgi:hypothetical protein